MVTAAVRNAKAAKQAKARPPQAPTATVSAPPLLALPSMDDDAAPPPPPPLAPAPGQQQMQMQYYDQERVIYDGSQNYRVL